MSTSGEFDYDLNNSAGCTSFWELKQYGRCVRRLENGNKLCNDICNMIQDRVEIEKNYSTALHKWSTKWSAYLDNGVEYGTTKNGWLGWCMEAELLSDMYREMRNKLVVEVQAEVRNWQKEHFHKATLPPQNIKEAKALESEFEIAQKPWAKKLKKMTQCKKDYHQQCKMIRSFEVHNRNALNDSGISQEQLKKMEEKLRKAELDCAKCKTLYEISLQNLVGDRGRYTDEMNKVFVKSQSMERERMTFLKSIFFKIQKILNLSENRSLGDIYWNCEKTIESVDPDLDVKQWSHTYGPDTSFICPQFEEYTQELHSISKKKYNQNHDSGVTLTAVNITSRQASIYSGDTVSRSTVTPPFDFVPSTPSPNIIEATTPRSLSRESPVFSDEYGTQVRALYDYVGVEEDELTLKEGDIFMKVENEDEQGWCKGNKDGRVGLYPANYAVDV